MVSLHLDVFLTIVPLVDSSTFAIVFTSNGDSGGPLYDAENGVVAGIVSFGGGCAHEQYPGVYARISNQVRATATERIPKFGFTYPSWICLSSG